MDAAETMDIIARMKLAKIGEYSKWEEIAGKIMDGDALTAEDAKYYARMTRIYRGTRGAPRKTYHTRLSEHDAKPPCRACGSESMYYCNMNDEYYCQAHVIGHDENEP